MQLIAKNKHCQLLLHLLFIVEQLKKNVIVASQYDDVADVQFAVDRVDSKLQTRAAVQRLWE